MNIARCQAQVLHGVRRRNWPSSSSCFWRQRWCWTHGRASGRNRAHGAVVGRAGGRSVSESRSTRSPAKHPDIEVRVNVVAFVTYFNTLRTDVAGGSADDIFWLSNANFTGYADGGRLMDIAQAMVGSKLCQLVGTPRWSDSSPVTATLWGDPQLTDAGIAVYYNADLLDGGGRRPSELVGVRWAPGDVDTLRPLLARLTIDANGRRRHTGIRRQADSPVGLQRGQRPAGHLPELYRLGGRHFSDGDRFAFDNPRRRGFRLPRGADQRRPRRPARVRHQWQRRLLPQPVPAGRMALFQSGTYNLARSPSRARFRWGVAMLPCGPSAGSA